MNLELKELKSFRIKQWLTYRCQPLFFIISYVEKNKVRSEKNAYR